MTATLIQAIRRRLPRVLVAVQLALAVAGCMASEADLATEGEPTIDQPEAPGASAATARTEDSDRIDKGGAFRSCESFWLSDGYALVGSCLRADRRTLNVSGVWLPHAVSNVNGWPRFGGAGFDRTCWGCSVQTRFGRLQLICSCLYADQRVNPEAILELDTHITNNDGVLTIDR